MDENLKYLKFVVLKVLFLVLTAIYLNILGLGTDTPFFWVTLYLIGHTMIYFEAYVCSGAHKPKSDEG